MSTTPPTDAAGLTAADAAAADTAAAGPIAADTAAADTAAATASASPTDRAALEAELPQAGGPATAWHLPTAADADGTLYVSGQVPFTDDGGLLHTGRLASEADVEVGVACARRCAAHVLAQLKAAADGDLGRVTLLKLTVFVASAPEFTLQPVVANGASELVHAVLGERGRHARSAVGVASLPLGVPVEVEAVARLAPAA